MKQACEYLQIPCRSTKLEVPGEFQERYSSFLKSHSPVPSRHRLLICWWWSAYGTVDIHSRILDFLSSATALAHLPFSGCVFWMGFRTSYVLMYHVKLKQQHPTALELCLGTCSYMASKLSAFRSIAGSYIGLRRQQYSAPQFPPSLQQLGGRWKSLSW